MDTPIKFKKPLVERLDFHKNRLGFTRQRLANNLLYIALGILDTQGYEVLLKLESSDQPICTKDMSSSIEKA